MANMVEQTWWTRYPMPQEVTYAGGQEFKLFRKRRIQIKGETCNRPICWGRKCNMLGSVQQLPHHPESNTKAISLGRNMILNIKHEADWQLVCEQKLA